LDAFDLSEHLKKYAHRYQIDLQSSLSFLEWLDKQRPNCGKPTIRWKEPSYRVVYGGFQPLSVAGSLAVGGRFNIGGAQMSALFPNLAMRACLYTASHPKCARLEAGEPKGAAQICVIKPKSPLELWNLQEIIENELPFQGLKEIVDATPLAARWELQKVPKISQLLGHFIRQQGGDGLVYPSTKDPKQHILAFFIQDDVHADKTFSAGLAEP